MGSIIRAHFIAPLLLGLGGCGDNHPCQGPAEVVRVDVRGLPTLLAYRNGDGPWEVLSPAPDETIELCIENTYELLSACDYGNGGFYAERQATTIHENHEIVTPLCFPSDPVDPGGPLERLLVTGEVQQAAHVWIGEANWGSTSGPWEFELGVRPGSHDLVVSDGYGKPDGGDRVLIRRDLSITEATRTEPVDLVADGLLMVPVPLEIANARAEDAVSTRVVWDTKPSVPNGGVIVSETATRTAHVVPPELVEADDTQVISVSAHSGGYSRATTMWYEDSTRSVELLPLVAGMQLSYAQPDGAVVTWSDLSVSDYTRLSLAIRNLGLETTGQRVFATRGWLEAHGSNQLDFDIDLAEYDPAWTVRLDEQFLWWFRAERHADRRTSSSGFTEVVEP